jgi:hypothetical protein
VTLYIEAVDEHHHGQPKLKLLETSRYRVTTQDVSDGRQIFVLYGAAWLSVYAGATETRYFLPELSRDVFVAAF